VRCKWPPIYKRPVFSPISDIGTKEDAQTGQETVEGGRSEPANTRGGGSGDAADGQVTTGTTGPKRLCVAD
jgi:hypothetical protein